MAGRKSAGPPPAEGTPAWESWKAALAEVNYATFSVSVNLASIAANTVADQTFTCTGVLTDDVIAVNPPALTAGLL
jgi:hypothetical protein